MHSRFAGVLVAVLLASVTAHAQDEDQGRPDLNEAKTAFRAGQEFLEMDRFADAVVEFRKAFEITKDKLVMGQIALAYEKAGDYRAALQAVRVYREGLPASDRGSVDEMIKRYEKMIAQGRSKKLVLPTDKVSPGDQESGAGPTDDDTSAPVAGETSAPRRKARFWTWIAAGSTGALALGALVVGLNAQSKYDDLEASCAPMCANSEVDSVRSRAVITDALWGMAAAAAVTTGVLYFLERPASVESPARGEEDTSDYKYEADDEEIDASLSRRLQVVPLVGPGGFGLGATLRY